MQIPGSATPLARSREPAAVLRCTCEAVLEPPAGTVLALPNQPGARRVEVRCSCGRTVRALVRDVEAR